MMPDDPSKLERGVSTAFGLTFVPWRWSAIERLRPFVGPPFKVERDVSKGVRMTDGHLGKFRILVTLANDQAPTLEQDRAQLEARGHTSALRSKEYAALVETLICSLYSAIDGMRLAIYGAHKGISKVQRGSNGELFEIASGKKFGPGFPEAIRLALDEANKSWFPDLRRYRTELIHGEVGSCHLDSKTDKIVYMHSSLGSATRALVIEDICAELSRLYTSVFDLAERVYGYLFTQLDPVTRRIVCGFYRGRLYERDVAPAPDLSFDSGTCRSLTWFEKEPGYECPLRGECGAYARAVAETAPGRVR
jgi:hypothetical protein